MNVLAKAATSGSLGLFLGTGFSMALTDNEAPSWHDLLEGISADLGIQDAFKKQTQTPGTSYARLASELCGALATAKSIDISEAISRVKAAVVTRTTLAPTEENQRVFTDLFERITPGWIVTTNYDFIAERVLRQSLSRLPSQRMSSPRGVTPVYHLHGHLLAPQSIILLEEDYVPLLRPNSYRQAKLAILLSESITLMLGYGLGDMNVLSALDLASQFDVEESPDHHGLVVQAYWAKSVQTAPPQKSINGAVLVPVSEICNFLTELAERCDVLRSETQKRRDTLKTLLSLDPADVVSARLEPRDKLIKFFQDNAELYGDDELIGFLQTALHQFLGKAGMPGGWEFYNQYLVATLDFLIHWDFERMPPVVFEFLAASLSDVIRQVWPKNQFALGYAQSATKTWHERKKELPSKVVESLKLYTRAKNDHWLEDLLNDV